MRHNQHGGLGEKARRGGNGMGHYQGIAQIGKTHFATCDRRTKRIVADTDFFVDDAIGKVVLASGHGTDEDGDVVCLRKSGEVFG